MEKTRNQVHFACAHVGEGYSFEYVENLCKGIDRNYSGDWTFTVITDKINDPRYGRVLGYKGRGSSLCSHEPEGCDECSNLKDIFLVQDRVLPKTPPQNQKNFWWWSKLNLFRTDIWKPKDTVVYIDLDSVITGDLQPIVDAANKDFSIIKWDGKWYPTNSSVMSFLAGQYEWVYSGFNFQNRFDFPKGDQQWITEEILHMRGINPIGLDLVASYRNHNYKSPWECVREASNARIVTFHGKPDPHELDKDSWLYKQWTSND